MRAVLLALAFATSLVACRDQLGIGDADDDVTGVTDPGDRDNEGDAVDQHDPPDAGPINVIPEPEPAPGREDGGQPERGCPPDCAPDAGTRYTREDAPNPILEENAHPGAPEWRSGRGARSAEVELYAASDSIFAGERLPVKVSTSLATEVTAEVYRMGHYGGAGARLMWRGGPYPTSKQAPCLRRNDTARVECAWKDTFEVPSAPAWVSGLYVVKIIRADGYRWFTPFVIRDRRKAEIVYSLAFNTYQAYNQWGGESLYMDASGTMPYGRAFEVSYDRPYHALDGTGKVFNQEMALIAFMERHGFDVSYVTNLDFVRFEGLIDGAGAFVHGAQDEYWDNRQREQVDAAVASGETSLVYFGGNGAYWRTRSLSSPAGAPLRVLVCFKGSPEDPVSGSTRRFRDDPEPHPENALLGVMYDGWQLFGYPLVVKNPDHWIFEGTGVTAGEVLPPLLGFEYDKVFDNGFSPKGLEIALESPVLSAENIPSRSHAVARTLPAGTIVFSAGSIWWPDGLGADPELADGRIEAITWNVLERAVAHRRPTRSAPRMGGFARSPPAPDARWAQRVENFAGVAGSAGLVNGPAAQAKFDGPTGIAMDAEGRVAVADTRNNVIRLIDIDPDRTVTTLAGRGDQGHRNGPGREAMFRNPVAVAFLPDGALLVADSDNHVIRRVELSTPEHTVSTFAGVMRASGWVDGDAAQAKFRRPTSLAVDALGNVYVGDQAGNRIRKIDAETKEVTTLAGGPLGFADAAVGTDARFNNPTAIALSPDGLNLYVIDGGNGPIRRLSLREGHAVDTLAGSLEKPWGFRDGKGDVARLRAQMGLAVSPDGELFVGDGGNFRIRKIVPGVSAASTQVYTFAGTGRAGTHLGTGAETDLAMPGGMLFLPPVEDQPHQLLVTDSFQHAIRRVTR